ncbi:MAG: efflux RND transporter periplasmic adaptor subunit [Candidatus Latescibacterota bacterium]
MDRPLNRGARLRVLARRATPVLVGSTALLGAVLWLPAWLQPTLQLAEVRLATVELGEVKAGVTASGVVVPAFEKVVASPLSARVLRIVARPGDRVVPGQPILELDTAGPELQIARLTEELALKRNEQRRLEQNLERRLADLEVTRRIRELEHANLAEKTAQMRTLAAQGGYARQDLRQRELEEERAALELDKVRRDADNEREATRTQIEAVGLAMNILERDRREAQRRLAQARVGADRAGVLTWVVSEEGATVGEGEVLARIADLSAFRVQATAHALHADRIRPGLPAEVVALGERLAGSVAHVLPAVQGSELQLEVQLDQPGHPRLRAEMRVEVQVITEHRLGGLRIEKGEFVPGGQGTYPVFVLQQDRAVRRQVRLGLAGYEHYEVLEGLQQGDRVIASSMEQHENQREIAVR